MTKKKKYVVPTITCPHCRTKRPQWERWCGKCGKKIPATTTR